MAMPEPNCPYCRERMELGVVLDHTQHSRTTVPEWVEGKPETSFWTGVKTKGKEKHSVLSYRCPRCGLLQHYALS